MADPVRPAEQIQHTIARQTRDAIAWTGIFQALLAALTLGWTVCRDWKKKGEKKEEREKRDEEEKKRRERADEEDAKRRERADEDDVKRREMAERGAEERRNAAAKQLEDLVQRIRKDHIRLCRDVDAAKLDIEKLKTHYDTELFQKEEEILDLRRDKAELQRRLDSSPGWAPGGSGETSTVAGG